MNRALPFLVILAACAVDEEFETDLTEAEYAALEEDPSLLADDHAPPPPLFTKFGTCPGPVRFTLDFMATPGTHAIIRSNGTGGFLVPSGPCAGTNTGLSASGIGLIGTFPTPGLGFGIPANLPPAMCGKYLVVIDLATCLASNVVGPL